MTSRPRNDALSLTELAELPSVPPISYDASEDSWEPESAILDTRLIREFDQSAAATSNTVATSTSAASSAAAVKKRKAEGPSPPPSLHPLVRVSQPLDDDEEGDDDEGAAAYGRGGGGGGGGARGSAAGLASAAAAAGGSMVQMGGGGYALYSTKRESRVGPHRYQAQISPFLEVSRPACPISNHVSSTHTPALLVPVQR